MKKIVGEENEGPDVLKMREKRVSYLAREIVQTAIVDFDWRKWVHNIHK